MARRTVVVSLPRPLDGRGAHVITLRCKARLAQESTVLALRRGHRSLSEFIRSLLEEAVAQAKKERR